MIFKVSLTQMSARACLSPFKPFSQRKRGGVDRDVPFGRAASASLCSQLIIHTQWKRRVLRLDVWQDQPLTWDVCPMFHTLSSGKHGQTSPHSQWRHPAAECVFTAPHSSLLLQQRRGWPQTLLTHWLTALVSRRQLTDNPNFYYSTRNQPTGPNIRHVPAPWPISCHPCTVPQLLLYIT